LTRVPPQFVTSSNCFRELNEIDEEEIPWEIEGNVYLNVLDIPQWRFTDDQIKQSQLIDEEIRMALNNEFKPQSSLSHIQKQLVVNNGILMRKFRPVRDEIMIPIIGKSLHDEVLNLAHLNHQGTNAMFDFIKLKGFIPNLREKCQQLVNNCSHCSAVSKFSRSDSPVSFNSIGSSPFNMVYIDLLQMPEDIHNNKCIVVIIDSLSRMILADAIKSKAVNDVVSSIEKLFRHVGGYPEIIRCDNGMEFQNHIFRTMCKERNISIHYGPIYHPQGQGTVERGNSQLLQLFRILRSQNRIQNDWSLFLQLVCDVYNSKCHSSLNGLSPNDVVFGKKTTGIVPITKLSEVVSNLFLERAKLIDLCMLYHVKNSRVNKSNDAPNPFKIGDHVSLKYQSRTKMDPKWLSGWKITRIINENLVEIVNNFGNYKSIRTELIKLSSPRVSQYGRTINPNPAR
jgi:Integrase core domain/Integrase zinc binding domain